MTILLQGAGLQTAATAPVPPLFVSAEVGTVNASTVAVTFDQDVSAAGSDYSSGVTIKVNGSTRAFESGIRQANHAVVYYALSLAVVFGDIVTWEYSAIGGAIVAEDDSAALEDVSAQSVTNNVAAVPLLDLEADQLILNDGDHVLLWTDGTNNFIKELASPIKQTISSYPAVNFVFGDNLIGSNSLADNLDQFTVFIVKAITGDGNEQQPVISKMNNYSSGAGWMIFKSGFSIVTQEDGGSVYYQKDYDSTGFSTSKKIFTIVFSSKNSFSLYINRVLQTPINISDSGPVVNMTTTDSVRINTNGNQNDGFAGQTTYAVRIYPGVLGDTGRATIEAELAARYGITL